MKKILLAFQFLTIIPVKEVKEVSEKEMGSASAFFPLIGFAQGLLLVVAATLFLKVFPVELANGLLVFMIVLNNGFLHLDGLADTSDALFSRKDKKAKLSIMKESTIGSIGAASIVLAILLKYLSLNALFINSSPITYLSLLFLMPVFSRWVMVPAIFHGKSAKQEGLGRIFIENTGLRELFIATFFTLSFLILNLFIANKMVVYSTSQLSFFSFLFVMLVLYIFSIIAVWFFNKKFGGLTGDTLGAISELTEIIFLLMVIGWLRLYI